MITNYWGDTRQGWETLFGSMITLPADQKTAVSNYLATHFPVKPASEAKLIPGPVARVVQGMGGAHAWFAPA